MSVAGRLAVLVVVGRREPDDEDQGDDEPARARADADPEDPRELDRPCSHSHTWWQARSSWRADAPTQRAMRLPVPPPHAPTRERAPVRQARPLLRRDPRADGRDHRGRRAQRRRASRSAHKRVTTRRGAAHHRRPAGRGRLRRPPLRPDADGAHQRQPRAATRWTTSVFEARRRRPAQTDGRRPELDRARSTPPARSRRSRTSTPSSTRAVKRGDTRLRRADRRRLRATRPPTASSPPSSATSTQANRERAAGRRSASPRSRPATRRTTHRHRRAGAAGRARASPSGSPATSAAACAPLSRAAEALAEGDVDHELSVKRPRRGRAHRRAPWPRWSSTCARWPAPPTAWPRAT